MYVHHKCKYTYICITNQLICNCIANTNAETFLTFDETFGFWELQAILVGCIRYIFAEMNVLYHYYFYTLLEISIVLLLINSVAFFMHLMLHYQLSFWLTKFLFKLHNMLSQYFAVKLSCFRNISIAPVINLLPRYTNEQYIVRHFKARPTQIEFGKCSAFVSIFH